MYSNLKGPVNIGNPKSITIDELSKIIIKMFDKNITVNFKPLPSDDPLQRCPDISLAKKELGWEPKISFEKGLEATINYINESLNK